MGKLPTGPKHNRFHRSNNKTPSKKPGTKIRSQEQILKTLQNGIDLQRSGKLKEAEYYYQLVLRDHPKQADALNLMGVLAADGKMFEVSAEFLERAVKSRPKDPVILNNLANAYIMIDTPKLAIPLLKKALRLSSEYYEASLNLARAYRAMGMATQSLAAYEQVLSKKPENIAARIGMAEALVDAGKPDEAVGIFRDIIEEKPRSPMAYFGLSSAKKFKRSDPEPDNIEALLQDASLDDESLEYLHYSAGKMYHDMARYDEAFRHFASAKELVNSRFDLARFRNEVDDLIDLFDRPFFDNRKGVGCPDERPVFIVGMPRSGTTLTEQIIASHPNVHGAGELSNIHQLSKQVMPLLFGERQPETRQLRPGDFLAFAKQYLDEIGAAGNAFVRVTDKMPHNFRHLGLIALLFPNAKIIHCLRDPMDNCVSCFTNKFNQAHGYNTSLRTLGLYYREYRRLMEHWSTVLPIEILTVHYEQTIADQENASRKMIDYLNLPWDEACLDFHHTSRDVSTLSRWQVRQPIYKSSIGRWRNFEEHLGELKLGLGGYYAHE